MTRPCLTWAIEGLSQCHEFMRAATRRAQETAFYTIPPHPWALPSLQCSPSLGCGDGHRCPTYIGHSVVTYLPTLEQTQVSVVSTVHDKSKPLFPKLTSALTYGNKDEYLEGNLTGISYLFMKEQQPSTRTHDHPSHRFLARFTGPDVSDRLWHGRQFQSGSDWLLS